MDLNAGSPVAGGLPLWLHVVKASRPVARCVVVDNRTKGKRVYGPPEAAGKYPIEWVQELAPDSLNPPYPDLPRDAQDLNEGEFIPFFFLSDYIYIGYCRDWGAFLELFMRARQPLLEAQAKLGDCARNPGDCVRDDGPGADRHGHRERMGRLMGHLKGHAMRQSSAPWRLRSSPRR